MIHKSSTTILHYFLASSTTRAVMSFPMKVAVEKPWPIRRLKQDYLRDWIESGTKPINVDDAGERNRALTIAIRHGVKITTRKLDGKGYRVWKI